MSTDGWSVQEAAERLLCSDSTIRRRLRENGDLSAVDGPGPTRVTRSSVDAAQADMLRRMGVGNSCPQGSCTNSQGADRDSAALATEVERLEADLALARGALDDLTAAHSALLDTFRRLSAGATPNR